MLMAIYVCMYFYRIHIFLCAKIYHAESEIRQRVREWNGKWRGPPDLQPSNLNNQVICLLSIWCAAVPALLHQNKLYKIYINTRRHTHTSDVV